jgi:hypothetical protein
MASLSIVLKIAESENGALYNIITNSDSNNVSLNPNSNIIKVNQSSLTEMQKNNGHLGIPIYGKIGDYIGVKRLLKDGGYNGYMWGKTDNQGNYGLEISLNGLNMYKVGFFFDKEAGQYPVHYKVTLLDGSTKEFFNETNDSNELEMIFQGGEGIQKVLFDKWKKPNYNVSLTFIELKPSVLLMNKKWINRFDSQSEKISNATTIEYGCLSNNGSIQLRDINENEGKNKKGTLYLYAEYGYLDTNMFGLTFYMNGKKLQEHIPSDSPYYNDDNTLEIELTNELSLWNNIDCESIIYNSETTLYQVLKDVFNTINIEVDNTLTTNINVSSSFGEHEEMTVKEYLKSIKIPSFTLEKDSLTNQINKICTVAQLHLFIDDDGNLKFVNARPVATDEELSEENIVDVRYYQQYGSPKTTILVSNKYDEVVFR